MKLDKNIFVTDAKITFMPLKLLYNFFRLQIPNINDVILRAAHNPLSTGHRKVGENTVLFIFVAIIRFQALEQ